MNWSEFPAIQEILLETRHKFILRVLQVRFGPVPPEVAAAVRAIQDDSKLDSLIDLTAICPTLEAFRLGIPT